MRCRIDYRWILTTSVVVAVAAAGTAAVVRQGHPYGDVTDPGASGDTLPVNGAARLAGVIEPVRLSRDFAGTGQNLPAFESEALPPVFPSRLDRSPDAIRAFQGSAPGWVLRSQVASARFSNGGSERWFGSDGQGGGIGWEDRSAASGHGVSSQAPLSRPANSAGATGRTSEPRPPAPRAPGAPSAPGGPVTDPGHPSPPLVNTGVVPPTNPLVGDLPPAPADPPAGGAAPAGPDPISPTPEPGSLVLIGTGLAAMSGALRRRLG